VTDRVGTRPALTLWLALAATTVASAESTLTVSVAISLRPVVQELTGRWSEAEPRSTLVLNAGGSGVLVQQIRRGAPVDLFISASPHELDLLAAEGRLLDGSRTILASNTLVVVVPAGRPAPADAAALAGPRYDRIAIGNPRTAPLGRYSRASLQALDLWESLQPRLVPAENAMQALQYVARGEVAAGIVYMSDLRLAADRIVAGPRLPSPLPIRYEAAILEDCRAPTAARELLDLLISDAGAAALELHGFLPHAPE
jgi:molybdate transport system substrate-binding protein